MRRVARWVGVVGVLALALTAGRAGAAPTANGRIVYGNTTTTPQARAYTASTNTFAAAGAAGAAAGANVTYTVDRAAPTRNEHIVGYVTTGGILYILRWNGTAWSNEWNVTVGGAGANGRRFDIAYEQTTGNAMVVYSTNGSGATAELAYRIWNGSTWTAAQTIQSARLTGAANWVKLDSRHAASTNSIALAVSDTAGDLTAFVWNGSVWGNEPTAALSTILQQSTVAGDKDAFDVAYENQSGDIFLVYSETTPANYYRTFSAGTSTWGAATTLSATGRTIFSMFAVADPDPTSNRVVAGWDRSASANRYAVVWDGTTLGTVTTIGNNANATNPPTTSHQMTGAWVVAGASKRAVVVYQSTTTTSVDYAYFDVTAGTWTVTQSQTGFTSGDKRWVAMDTDPRSSDTAMLTYSDLNGDLWAKRLVYDGTSMNWVNADGGAALTTTLTNLTSSCFSFAYDRFSNTIQLSTATADPTPAGVLCPGATGVYADRFAFTVTGAADRVSALTVSGLAASTPLQNLSVSSDAGAAISTASPTGNTQAYAFTTPNLAAAAGATTNYRLYFDVKSQAALDALGKVDYTVTPIVLDTYTATNTKTAGSDTASAWTIDNSAEATPTAFSAAQGTPAYSTINLSWSGTASWYAVYAIKGASTPGDVVADGTDVPGPAGSPNPSTSWLAYVGSGTSASIGGLDPSSQYTFKIFARDACINWSGAATASTSTGASPMTVTVGNGAGVTATAIAPGATWTPVDSFDVTVTSGTPTGSLTGITYTAITGMSQYLAGVRFVRASDGLVLGTDTTPTGEVWSITIAAGTDLLSGSSKAYRVEVQPKTHAQIDAISPVPGATFTLAPGTMTQDAVTAITTSAGASVSYADGSTADPFFGSVVIDNLSPANVTGASAIGGGLEATFAWTNPGDADFQKVVICGKTSALAASDKPAEGADPVAGNACGTASVVYVGAGSPAIVDLAASTTWYFRFFSRDASGNFSSGVTVGPVTVENFQSDGDLTPWSNRPVVSIINPKSGAVLTLPAKVQVRVFSPGAGGALVPADTVNLVVGGVNHALATAARNTKYTPSSATAGVWEYTIPSLAFAAGANVELRANATNGAGGPVYSARVFVKISLARGDGNLLVRDDSSQLCTDCHAGITTHSSEFAGNKHGSWAATCRDCHTAHETTNISLVSQQIKPLEVNGTTTSIAVDFKNRTGYAASSFASPAKNGPCQVCHTRTDYYLNTGLDGDGSVSGNGTTGHNPSSPCTGCHLHTKGLGASCTSCHGTEGRGAVAGADSHHAAAPPAVAALATVKVATNNAHLAHTSEANLRATPFACVECHSTMKHQTTHEVDMGYGTVATGNGAVTAAQLTPAAGALAAGFATTPTCTNYCHSDAKPLGTANATFPATLPRWDGGNTGTVLGCTSCHGDGVTGLALSAKHAKHLSATTYNYTCDECHAGVVANDQRTVLVADRSLHVNGARNVTFSASYRTSTIDNSFGGYSYSPGYSCSAIYCHSNGASTSSFVSADPSVTWNGGSVTCGSCHPTPMASGTHPSHVASATTGAYGCQTCHVTTTSDGASIASYTLHVNGAKDVTGVTTWDGLGKTCSSNYCHSSGRRVVGSRLYTQMTWGSATDIGCNGCHGKTSPYGAPDYANTGADTADANGHQKHVGSAGDCSNCHFGFVTAAGTAIQGTNHTNQTINVAFNTAVTGNVTYTAGTATLSATCTSVSCHGSNSGTLVKWGGSMPAWTCSSCHGATADVNDWDPSNGIASKINTSGAPNEWTSYGHGNTAATFDEFTGATDRCLYCHDGNVAHRTTTNPFRLRGASTAAAGATGTYDAASAMNGNEVCLNCHDSAAANGVDPEGAAGGQPRVCQLTGANPCDQRVDAWHYGKRHAAGNDGGTRCWDCHDPHGDGTNLAMIGSDTLRQSADPYGLAGTRSTNAAVLTTQGAGGYANTTTRNGVCQVCHTQTKYYRFDSEPQAHQAGADCTVQCHQHQQTTRSVAFKGNGDCKLCHDGTQSGSRTRNILTEFGSTWSHTRSKNATGGVTKWDCIVCHMEGTPDADASLSDVHGDGVVNLRDPDTGLNIEGVSFSQTVYSDSTNGGSYTSSGVPFTFTQFSRNLGSNQLEPAVQAIMINQCLKCHDSDGAKALLPGGVLAPIAVAGLAGTAYTPEKPFGATISGAAYTGNGITANGMLGGVTDVKASFVTTNASYHPILGKQNNSYVGNTKMNAPWNTLPTNKTGGTINTATSWGFLISCWDCHAPNGTLSTVTLTGTVTAHGGATTIRQAVWSSSSTYTNNLCRVCHNVATTQSGHGTGSAAATVDNHAGPYMVSQCYQCHSSSRARPARPIPGQDAHGFDSFAPAMGTDTMWPLGATNTWRPYAFFRNVGTGNSWSRTTSAWRPTSGPGVPAGTANCAGECNGESASATYTPGGVY